MYVEVQFAILLSNDRNSEASSFTWLTFDLMLPEHMSVRRVVKLIPRKRVSPESAPKAKAINKAHVPYYHTHYKN